MKIGILAIQGSVEEHTKVLGKLGIEVQEVRLPEDLHGIAGIILPGGESTAQSKLLQRFGLFSLLREKISQGLPAYGTCAGAILLARTVQGKNAPETLEVMDIVADRNWYGGQLDSFIAPLEIHFPIKTIFLEGIFIRAPKLGIGKAADVRILASHDQTPVLLQQRNMLAGAFHPELSESTEVHEYFLSLCAA